MSLPPDGAEYYAWLSQERELDQLLRSRKAKKVVEKLLKEVPEIEADEAEAPTDKYFNERLAVAGKQATQLRQEIETRVELHDYFLARLDYQIREAAFSLSQVSSWGIGYNTGVDVKRNFLERQLAQFRKERRETELRAWEDIVDLRKELREATAEYRELRRRYRLMRIGDGDGD